MRRSKTTPSRPDFKIQAKKTTVIQPETVLIHPRFEIKTSGSTEKKAPNSLLALMYSQENDVLFI
ncbi:hypothetical protein [Flavobacterium caseinilyticum]|uniref:Uncharacterized protein n=1 Tax=Flavobacterium caseinilyticum TaxID=2541732 RepID=A0A4R5AX48_9FLAO|nr:hypothetical protein [Flavobacterium caseinilyticum]TDD76296.1 hypothetical protein E0F89_08720 [Flavobacterium caseinilyticum]